MREVEIRIRMLEPCLAGRKGDNPGNEPDFVFDRDASGEKALIMQTEWKRVLRFACKALSVNSRLADSVWFDPVVTGTIGIYDRQYKDKTAPPPGNRFKKHEAFLSGTVLTIRAVLRDNLWLKTFRRILEAGGRYAGLTTACFGDYGRFEVLSVK